MIALFAVKLGQKSFIRVAPEEMKLLLSKFRVFKKSEFLQFCKNANVPNKFCPIKMHLHKRSLGRCCLSFWSHCPGSQAEQENRT
jgi:hypothetical protein